MRREPKLILATLGLALLWARSDSNAAACDVASQTPGQCFANSAIAQRAVPATVTTDDRGDATFFASQSGQLPNVMFLLDNSTSMYELAFDLAAYPNSSWVTTIPAAVKKAKPTMAACSTSTWGGSGPTATCWHFTSEPATAGNGKFDSAANVNLCRNAYLDGLTDAAGNKYDQTKTYAPPDSAFTTYFDSAKVYKWMEWNTSSPGGTANGTTPVQPVTGGRSGQAASAACSGFDNSNESGGQSSPAPISGSAPLNSWGITEQQRCQQCLDAVGYYVGSSTKAANGKGGNNAAGGNDGSGSNSILFDGNWLNFYPPKFITARKAVTDFIARQVATPTPVRLGVTTYDPNNINALGLNGTPPTALQTNDGGKMVTSGMVPDCNTTVWTQAQADAMVTSVRGVSFGSAGSPIATPLAETLFNIGQFFTNDDQFYKDNFGSAWLKTGFSAAGLAAAKKPLCVSCQVNAVVIITDGEPYGDNNLPDKFPSTSVTTGKVVKNTLANNSVDCTGCGVDGANSSKNLLDDVASMLANNDLNNNDNNNNASALDGIQDVLTFVIGMGLQVPLLDNTASVGKGFPSAIRADGAADLQDAVTNAVVNIIRRSTAFSSTAIQTLEVGTGSTAYVPRFFPGSPSEAVWEGHLFRFNLFNEFVANVDKNGDGKLEGVFLVDKDGSVISEDDKGSFHKVTFNPDGSQTLGAAAKPIWDAGDTLNGIPAGSTTPDMPYATWQNRTLYTAIWDTVNSKWKTVPWPTSVTDVNFAAVRDAMGLTNTDACTSIQTQMSAPWLTSPSPYANWVVAGVPTGCALAIMDFIRGANILNDWAGSKSAAATTNATTPWKLNRSHMLGDIFHSSPVVVDPPVDQFICNLGLAAQCVSTLYGYKYGNGYVTATPGPLVDAGGGKMVDPYEKWWLDLNMNSPRKRIALVGSNDGMVHAFNAGSASTSPGTIDTTSPFRRVVYDDGDGSELWAFVPPDQLARTWLMMRDGRQYYMDGDIMVRDVWVDGVKNPLVTGTYTNDVLKKQPEEYHTIAIAGERQGGTHFAALDITNTASPVFLWSYPPPCSAEELAWGETYGQFSPRPPPVGPVLLEIDAASTAGQTNYGKKTEERWVAVLNGGHDAFMNRGHAVAMVDVYTGKEIFKALYNSTTSVDGTLPLDQMRFAFPSTAALVDYGNGNSYAPDTFFDTAVFGDEGGQLWTLRFGEPGSCPSKKCGDGTANGLASNWAFGRSYENGRSTTGANSDSADTHQPIYSVAAMTVQPETGWLRAYVGTGDRAHIRSSGGGDCRPDDLMTCVAAGCGVTAKLDIDNGEKHFYSEFKSNSSGSLTSTLQTPTNTSNICAASGVKADINITGSGVCAGVNEVPSWTCSGTSACSEGAFKQPTQSSTNNRGIASASGYTRFNNFVSVAVLADTIGTGSNARTRRMNTKADAYRYDQNRIALSDLVDVTGVKATSTAITAGTPAGRNSAGWAYKYALVDEKTVTSPTILGGCVVWSSLNPGAAAVGCASAGSSTAYFYQSDAITGAPNCSSSFLDANNVYARSIARNVLSPPPEPSPAVAYSSSSKALRFSTLEIQPGKNEVTQVTVNTSNELLQMMYSLPLTVDQHQCRHVDPASCQ